MLQFAAGLVLLITCGAAVVAKVINVGPPGSGADYEMLEVAVDNAEAGDVIAVHPRPGNAPYTQTALLIDRRLFIYAVRDANAPPIPLTGDGFDYDGVGATPRAIVEFLPRASGSILKGFELSGARNASGNAAGVRILGANQVAIRQCDIHHNDMGVMSSPFSQEHAAADQLIEDCEIHHNAPPAGSEAAAGREGMAHNLYLAGESATVIGCNIHDALDGHNIKSRARFTLIEANYIHHARNREIDLVDSAMTVQAGANATVIGNVIVKTPQADEDPQRRGNRAVIQFGQDGQASRYGTLYLLFNTIVTPYVSPVVELSSPNVGLMMINNLIADEGAPVRGQTLVAADRNGATLRYVRGSHNWVSPGFAASADALMLTDNLATQGVPPFRDPAAGDYRLRLATSGITDAGLRSFGLPPIPGKTLGGQALELNQFTPPAGHALRTFRNAPDVGAYESQ